MGRWLHPTVVQGLEVRRTTSEGTTKRENGRRKRHVAGTQSELSTEFEGIALKSTGRSRCSREAASAERATIAA